MPIISIIAAVASNMVIGKDNKLPWYIPEDLAWFKANTIGKPIIMGRKTHESIGRKLPGRLNVVLSANQNYVPLGNQVKVYNSLPSAISSINAEEIVIIGGGKVYHDAMSLATKMYITRIHKEIAGDAFFPRIDDGWVVSERTVSSHNDLVYEFQILNKKQ